MVKILIYVHNNCETVELCLNAVVNMSGETPKEIIVIDDGSIDNSIEQLSGYEQIKIVKHEFLGITKAINQQLCNIGDNDLVRINGNVVIKTENWLDELQKTIYKSAETGIAGVRLLFADDRIETDGRNFVNGLGYEERHINLNAFKVNTDCKTQIIEVDSVCSALAYYKNDVLKTAGYFDENYFPMFTEDDDYCISARINNYSVISNSFIQAYHFIPVKSPTDLQLPVEQEEVFSPLTDYRKLIQGEHSKYWKSKWLWDLYYPDLNLIRKLYGKTGVCWNIGKKLKLECNEKFPSVDICLVTWNNLSLLQRMMESLAKTDYPQDKINIYITDNGSKDGTVDYLKLLEREYSFKIHNQFLPFNSGVAYGLNLAVIKGNGKLVARLDDDIILPADWLMELVKVIINRPYCGMTGPKVLNDNSIHSIQCTDFKLFPSYQTHENEIDTGQADYFSKTAHLRGCCNLYRRDVFENCGLFDIRFSPSQFDDPDHQISMLARGYEIIYNGYVAIIHKLNSGVNNSYAGLSNMLGNQHKFFGKWGNNIYELLDKSIEFSYEGRRIEIDDNISKNPVLETKVKYIRNNEFCAAATKVINFRIINQNNINLFIESFYKNVLEIFRSNNYHNAITVLHTALNFDPSRINTVLFLYITYFKLGALEKADHFKNLLKVLNKKNIDKLETQSEFYKEKYFKSIVSQLNMNPVHNSLETIIERLIIEQQFSLALFMSMFLFEESLEKTEN